MKKLLFIIIGFAFTFQSCIIQSTDCYDSEAFLKLNWKYEEPDYIETNGALPTNFFYNQYYKTYEGIHLIEFGFYDYVGYEEVVYPFEVEIEISTFDDNCSSYEKNVFFDLWLFPDGDIEFTHEFKSAKINSAKVDEKGREKIGIKEQTIDNKRVVCTYYKLPMRTK